MERPNPHSRAPIRLNKADHGFPDRVNRLSGENVHLCWHCRSCSLGCPFTGAMDYLPNEIIRLVQLGQKQEALESATIWICAGCHTCSTNCPQPIDMAAVMDALRTLALEENAPVAEPDILRFHQEVLGSIRRHGRTHKLEIMLRYKLFKRDWLADMDIGIRMLAKKKLDLTPSRVAQIDEIEAFFRKGERGMACGKP